MPVHYAHCTKKNANSPYFYFLFFELLFAFLR